MASSSPSSTTTAGASDAITALKLVHDGRVKRVAIADAKALTFEALTNLIRESFPDTLGSLAADASLPTVHYEDDEKDMVVVDSSQELAEAFRVTAANPTARVLRLTIEALPAAGAAEASTKTTEATTTTTTANEGDADDEDDDDDDAMYGDDNDDSTDAAIAAALADSFQQAATPPAAPAAPAAATTDDAAQSFNNIASAFGIDPAVARSMLGPERAGMAEKFLNKAFQGQAAPTAATTPAASATPATGAGAGTPPPFMQHLMQAFAGGNNAGAGAGAGSGAGTAAAAAARPASLGSAIRQMLGSFGVDMPACADAEAETHDDDDEGNCSDDSKEGDKASAEGDDDDDGAADAGVAVHRGISCDGCNAAPIRGIRYKSVTAFNFDVCEACEASGRYDDDHVFLKIRSPQHGRGVVQLIDRASARTPGSPFGIWGGGAQPAPPANPLAALFKAFGGAGGAGCHRRGGGGKRGGRCGKRGGRGRCGGKGKSGGACGAPGEGHPFANLMSTLRQHFGANCGPQAGAASSSSSSSSREQDDIAAAIAASLGAAAPTTTSAASSSSATPPATEAAIPTGVPVTTTNAEVPPPAGAGAGAGAAAAVMGTATATATATTTAPAASAPVTDEELVDKVDALVAMGFSAATAMYALRTHGGDVSKALSSLVDDN